MSSSSDSEDETQVQQLLEATDPSFLCLFQTANKAEKNTLPSKVKESLKSQKYLEEEHSSYETDINISSSMQSFMLKKMSELIEQLIEYEDVNSSRDYPKTDESCTKLLKGAKHFIKIDDKAKLDVLLQKRPLIKRRMVDFDTEEEKRKLSSVAVCAEDIINAKDVQFWAPRKSRNVFCYVKKMNGILTKKE